MTSIYSIVGMHYRPPAKAILQALPLGHPLLLRAEPANPYDPNAIMVLLETSTIPPNCYPTLETLSGGYGWDLSSILAQGEHHLAYIPAKQALECKALVEERGEKMTPDRDFGVELSCLANGNPAVKVDPKSISICTWFGTKE